MGRIGVDEAAAGGVEGGVEGGSLGGMEGPPERGLGEGGQQAHPPLGELGLASCPVESGRARAFVEGIEPGRASDTELDDLAANRASDDAPLAFGVARNVNAPAEGDEPGSQRFGQGGFASADLAGQEHVGIGEHTPPVQLPRVVAERRARPGILADEGAFEAEAFFGQERVGARQDLAGGPVGGDA